MSEVEDPSGAACCLARQMPLQSRWSGRHARILMARPAAAKKQLDLGETRPKRETDRDLWIAKQVA